MEKLKSGLLFLIFAMIFIGGIVFSITREDDGSEYVGKVSLVTEEGEKISLDGYKVSRQYKDDITTFDVPPLSETAGSLVTIQEFEYAQASQDSINTIKTSIEFSGNMYVDGSINYTVYDTGYEKFDGYEKVPFLVVPMGEDIDACIVQVDITWGRTKNNVTMRYFFKIQLR